MFKNIYQMVTDVLKISWNILSLRKIKTKFSNIKHFLFFIIVADLYALIPILLSTNILYPLLPE